MKNILFIISLIATSLFITACKNDPHKGDNTQNSNETTSNVEEDYNGFIEFDLRPYELNASLMVPEEDRTLIKHKLDTYEWDLIKGKQTYITIQDWGMINGFEKYLEKLDNQSQKVEFIEKEKNFTVYKLTTGTSKVTYHTAAQYEFDGVNYIFESSQQGLSEDGVKNAIVSVRSVEKISVNF